MTTILLNSDEPNLIPIQFDVEAGIKYYLPSLGKLITGNFSWTDLDKQWNKKVNEKLIIANGKKVKQIMTLLTLTTNAFKGQGFFEVQFLRFIDHVIKILVDKLSAQELELIKGNLYDMLIYSDSFLDHLGEIMVLADLITTKPYRLLKSEYRQNPKGVPIDFRFLDNQTNKHINIEVYCIKLTEKNFEAQPKYTLTEFIVGKLNAKIKKKDKSGLEYKVFPVLWLINTDEKDYMPDLISYFRENTISIDKVMTPHTIFMGRDSEDNPITQFLSILDFKQSKYKYF
jgi:hypothetical protein